MSGWSRFVQGDTAIDFVGRRRRWYVASGVALLAAAVALGVGRLNLGLEFRGGFAIQAENPAGAELSDVRDTLTVAGQESAVVQVINEGEAIRVETAPLDQGQQDELRQAISTVTGSPRDELSVEAVEPRFGALIARQALIALGVFLAVVALFISWRLQWKMAAAGLVALVHDMVITAGVYAITRFEVTSATVVALLTILGYSLYDTVVVFDRVTEDVETAGKNETWPSLVNRSMNRVLFRSTTTSLTSLLPVGSLLFVGSLALGAASLRDFALALFVGIASGTYSSIFVAGPLFAAWKADSPVESPRPSREREAGDRSSSYTPRLTTSSDARRPSGGSSRSRPPRPPKGGR
jgi:preprotein translocase subunit SecF